MGEDFANVDYDVGESDYEATLYCPNPECKNVFGADVQHEYDVNAHWIEDEDMICPECGTTATEEKPNFEETK